MHSLTSAEGEPFAKLVPVKTCSSERYVLGVLGDTGGEGGGGGSSNRYVLWVLVWVTSAVYAGFFRNKDDF